MSSNADLQSSSDLPPGWAQAPISEVAQLLRGVTYEKSVASEQPKSGYLPILRATNIQDEHLVLDADLVYVPERFVKPEQMLKPGDIVICMSSGSKHLVGKTAQLSQEWTGSFGAFCASARFNPALDHKFAAYFFSSTRYRNLIREKSSGVNINNLRHGDIESLLIPLPPIPEQHRIVAEIEKQFTRLDAGVAALKRVQANLKRYRASVLKAACEGRLAPQDPVDEPADHLLARILAERRTKWETEHPGKKYVEPAAPVTDGLPALPVGWCWTSVEQIGEVTGGLTKNQKRETLPTRLPYLRVANVYANELRLDDLLTIGIEDSEIKRVLLQDGDLLVVEGNGSADQIGRVAIWRDTVSPCVHQNHIIKIRFDPVDLGSFILYWLLSDGGRNQITQVASSTSGLYTLSLSKVAMLLIPVPPLPEQHRIVAEVERRLSVVAALEATVAANLARAGRLRQAVLKRAFEGRLVAQDANDATPVHHTVRT